jgi:TatA/E family protein of Tat protein translocase
LFGSLGFTEIAFILVLALLIFGPKRLPEIGRTIGKGLSEFRRASNDLKRTLEREVDLDDVEARPKPASPLTPARPPAIEISSPLAADEPATTDPSPVADPVPEARGSEAQSEPELEPRPASQPAPEERQD